MSISKKVLALVFAFVLFNVATAGGYHLVVQKVRDLALQNSSELMMQDYKSELKDVVDAQALSLASAIEGVKDEKEIHRIFTQLVKPARFFSDKSGYFYIYKVGGTVFVHATLPDLEGQNILDRRDPKGREYIRLLDQVSQQGGGYVEFFFNKPGKGETPKLGFARMIPGTQYWIGTGVYIDDVEDRKAQIAATISATTVSELRTLFLVLGAVFVLILVPLVVFLTVTIIRPLHQLTAVAESYSVGELDLEVPGTDRGDEIGSLAKALARLGVSIRTAMDRLRKARAHAAGAEAAGAHANGASSASGHF
jgi:signal transduction histidine kinase